MTPARYAALVKRAARLVSEARALHAAIDGPISKGGELDRELDELATVAATAAGLAMGGIVYADRRRRRVRKALGYTYP